MAGAKLDTDALHFGAGWGGIGPADERTHAREELMTNERRGHRRFLQANAQGLLNVTGKTVLGVVLLAFVSMPFAERSEAGLAFEAVMVSIVLVMGVLAVGGRRRALLIAASLAVPAVAARWSHFVSPQWAPPELYLSFATLAVGFVAWKFVVFIMTARRADSSMLCSAIAAFLLVAVVWSFVYQIVDRQVPGSFTFTVSSQAPRDMKGMFAVYFSLVTLCTVGFGDIVPTSDVARMLAMLEGATGVFFVAVLVSRLVSLHTAAQIEPEESNDLPSQERNVT